MLHQCSQYNSSHTSCTTLPFWFLFQWDPLLKVSHSRWICSTLVSWAICYCSNRQPVFLRQRWSRTCNVCWMCWCGILCGDFHASRACYIHNCESMKIISQEKGCGGVVTCVHPHCLKHEYPYTFLHAPEHPHTRPTSHARRCMHTYYLPREAERWQSGSSVSSSPALRLYPKSSRILLCVLRVVKNEMQWNHSPHWWHQGPWNTR